MTSGKYIRSFENEQRRIEAVRKSTLGKKQAQEHIQKMVEARKRNGSYVAWNKGTKGICKFNKTSFKKGLVPHNYKGGFVGQDGYKHLSKKSKSIREHDYVWITQSDWGFIPYGFVVHHINKNRIDNRIENLACISNSIHTFIHHIGQKRRSGACS